MVEEDIFYSIGTICVFLTQKESISDFYKSKGLKTILK